MNWTILGIAPTKDKKEITRAYRTKLVKVNPEDRPEEFKELRAVYEEALRLAEQEEQPAQEKTPVEQWRDRAAQLYADFQRRIRPEAWKELLSDEICIALDTRPLAEEALLQFFMEKYFLPQKVWLVIGEEFRFTERQQELYEKYPRDFVDYVLLDGMRYEDDLPYELFTPGTDGEACDVYRRQFRKVYRMNFSEAAAELEELQALPEKHPYGEALILQAQIAAGSEIAGAELTELIEQYPEDIHMIMIGANRYAECQDWENCEQKFRRVLELAPDHGGARWQLAHCLTKQNRYKEASELLADLMRAAGGDQKQLYQLNETRKVWNEVLIPQYREKIEADPEDEDAKVDLAWFLLQNERKKEAIAVAESIREDKVEPFDYYNLMSALIFEEKERERALNYSSKLIEIIVAMEPDGTEKTEKKIMRLPEIMTRHAHALYWLDRKEEAAAEMEQAAAIAPDNSDILTRCCQFFSYLKNYQRAAEMAQEIIRVRPGSYHGFLLLAQAMYDMNRDQQAYEAINRAIQLDGGDMYEYVLKMEILLRNGVYDEVHSVLGFLAENGVEEDNLSVLWFKAQLAEFEEEDSAAALEQYRAIAERVENGEEFGGWGAKLYLRMTTLIGDDLDANKPEDREQMLALLEKGLSHDPEDVYCLDYKAWLYKKAERNEEAIELYHRIEKRPRRSLNVEKELAELYYRDLAHHADKALHYYQMLLEEEETGDLHFYAGMCCYYKKDLEEAAKHFLREQELEPQDIDGYFRLGFVYEAMGRYEEAYEQSEKTIEIAKTRKGNQGQYFIRRIQLLNRLRRPDEAVRRTRELMSTYGYNYGEKLISETYRRFGMWRDEQKHIDIWRRNKNERSDVEQAQIELYLCMGDTAKAKKHFKKHEAKFSRGDAWALCRKIAILDGDVADEVAVVQNQLRARADSSYYLMHMAAAQIRLGNREQAKLYAQKAIEALEKDLNSYDPDEILARGEHCYMLAILGRMEEARAELARVKSMPLCQKCDYCTCKDADIYEVYIEDLDGNEDRALELAMEYKKKWPDEIDFLAVELEIKRRKH